MQDGFITGGVDGCVRVWNCARKRAIATLRDTHGVDASSGRARCGLLRKCVDCLPDKKGNRWVSSVGCFVGTDLFASGSCDGQLRFWHCSADGSLGGVHSAGTVELRGWINAIRFGQKHPFLVAALGKEHRMGRWFPNVGGTNGLAICRFDVDA